MTLQQFEFVIEQMKTIYDFDKSKTELSCMDIRSMTLDTVEIQTVDERTGVEIYMSKHVRKGECENETSN